MKTIRILKNHNYIIKEIFNSNIFDDRLFHILEISKKVFVNCDDYHSESSRKIKNKNKNFIVLFNKLNNLLSLIDFHIAIMVLVQEIHV